MVENIPRLFQAYVAPAIFISAAALLALSINVRLMGMVSRLREFHRRVLALLRRLANRVHETHFGIRMTFPQDFH